MRQPAERIAAVHAAESKFVGTTSRTSGVIPGAIEELLRFVSPVLWMSRLLTEDVELDGTAMRKGSQVRLGSGAANHDPSKFANRETLDIASANVQPVAFGQGLTTA
jgi:cytochrome P450